MESFVEIGREPDVPSERSAMVRDQILSRGLKDSRVLRAILAVPREEFVLPADRSQAYADRPANIGCEQTISQPFTVAFMADALQLQGTETVLEVGTGSGYGAAVLSQLAATVHTIERIPELAKRAAAALHRLGFANVQVHLGDGAAGLPDLAPFDAICVTAAAGELPTELVRQLAAGGRLLIPVGPSPGRQRMLRYTNQKEQVAVEDLGPFAFVPLITDRTN